MVNHENLAIILLFEKGNLFTFLLEFSFLLALDEEH